MSFKEAFQAFVEAAEAFRERALWDRFENDDCLAIRMPGVPDPLIACVMGAGGEEFGLMVLRGPNAVEQFECLCAGEGHAADALSGVDMVSFGFDPFSILDRDSADQFRRAGIRCGRQDTVPHCLVKAPFRDARPPQFAELTLLNTILHGIVKADETGKLQPATLYDDSGICNLDLRGEGRQVSVKVSWRRMELPDVVAGPQIFQPSDRDWADLEPNGATWFLATSPLPFRVSDSDEEGLVLVIFEADAPSALELSPFRASEIDEAIERVYETMQEAGRPTRIICGNQRIHARLAGPLLQAGCECEYDPEHPVLREGCRVLEATAEAMKTPLPIEEQDHRVPADDDLAGWRNAHVRLQTYLHQRLIHVEDYMSDDSAFAYLGDDNLEDYLETYGAMGVSQAYGWWFLLADRTGDGGKPRLDALLEEMPRAWVAVASAIRREPISIWRVDAVDKETLELEDVLRGGCRTVHDEYAWQVIKPGSYVTGRVFRVGRFNLFSIEGPTISCLAINPLLRLFRQHGVTFTSEGLHEAAGFFGHIWRHLHDVLDSTHLPTLVNTDGDPLVPHEAYFDVSDPAAVRRMLDRRDDIDYDEAQDIYVWLSRKQRGAGGKQSTQSTVLGQIELTDDGLVLSVNSAKRFNKARRWLVRIAGVSFREVETSDVSDAMAMAAPQSQDSDVRPIDPQTADALRRNVESHYERWLDEPLPALEDRSPREACKTADGREQVAVLIRAMPDIVGPVTIRPPRQKLLRELGLPIDKPVVVEVPADRERVK